MALCNVGDDSIELSRLRFIHEVGLIDTLHYAVSRDRNYSELVNLVEFRCLSHRSSGHSRNFLIETEVVLKCDRCKSLIFIFNLDALFGFERLVETFRIATPREHATCVLINNQELTIHYYIIFIALKKFFCTNRVIEVANQCGICSFIEIFDTK
ncbi:unannotated protein [freshwater metagenome]|uniref:Unannotated protein n=1 Tax=freshwater metagenome TaxID=449393 RepID=A0A6J5YL94_9ZZZZ